MRINNFTVSFAKTIISLTLLFGPKLLLAQTRLPAILGSNMVLQRNAPVPIWGWAAPGKQIKVAFAGQTLTATAAPDSLWQVKLSPLAANETPREMIIQAGSQQINLSNILVGEVWLCSGQSNMEYPIDKTEYKYTDPKRGIDSSEAELQRPHPGIRTIKIETKYNFHDATTNGWQNGEGKMFARSSVVAFFFAKQLRAKLRVPVGVITSAWNGSRIEPWTPPAAYKNIPAFAEDISQSDTLMDKEPEGKMYRSMIAPLIPFAIKGVIWYQGESNCLIEEHDMRYAYKMQAMIDYWRKQWNLQFPFYYVLVAPYHYTDWKNMPHTPETLPKFWEQQVAAAHIPNTAFINISDLVDNFSDIHPPYKWIVGQRLANKALAETYKRKGLAHLYPQYKGGKVSGNKMIVSFKDAKGLRTRDNKTPDFFELAGLDGNYVPANATIKGNTVILFNAKVPHPTEARFGWTHEATPNLVNADGLPAVPFRTDVKKWTYKVSAGN
ncbi:MAG: sialate O-acetylesterase [Mucilaginibacter sp.]|nr:sialate O-acetylesterase [Mucilaginibacter sp.]